MSSNFLTTERGVPQGHVLGSILLLIDVDGIVNAINNAHFTLIAGDISFIFSLQMYIINYAKNY